MRVDAVARCGVGQAWSAGKLVHGVEGGRGKRQKPGREEDVLLGLGRLARAADGKRRPEGSAHDSVGSCNSLKRARTDHDRLRVVCSQTSWWTMRTSTGTSSSLADACLPSPASAAVRIEAELDE